MKDFTAITATDSYKLGGHWNMLQNGTENSYAYGESRTGSEYPNMVWYGLQIILLKHLVGEVVTQEDLEEAKEISLYHLGSESYLNIEGWQTIIDEFGGKLPIEIYAAPEGEIIPEGNVLFTVSATDERFAWLANYPEGVLMKTYYPSVIATRSKITVDIVKHFFEISSDLPVDVAKFLVHDFGYRACPSEDAAGIGCSAHLINSLGTDTVTALRYAKKYYQGDYKTLGFSVPATEHRISCQYGMNERQYILDMMEKYRHGILSLVGDTNNIENFVKLICSLKNEIIERWENGKAPVNRVVVRPDSPRFKGDKPDEQVLWIYETLMETFGFTINSKGFKVMHPAVGTIYGDSLTTAQITDIYQLLVNKKYSIENCVVGQGGGLVMRDIDRDTQRFAIKGSADKINGEWRDVYKNPLDQSKASKKGRLKLVKMQIDPLDISKGTEYKTINEHHPLYHDLKDELVLVYRNGEMVKTWTFDEIRERAGKKNLYEEN